MGKNNMTTNPVFVGFNNEVFRRFGKMSILVGVLLAALGIAGALLPQIMALVINAFLGWTLIAAGMLSLYLVFISRGRSVITFLKPLLLIFFGVVLLVTPIVSIAAIALVMSFYLLLDAFSGFGLAHDIYPLRGWGWMVFNGLTSFALALVFMMGWPVSSLVMVGLFVGISLFFDGLALIFLGALANRSLKDA